MKKMEWKMPVHLPLVWRNLWYPNFVQVLQYSILKAYTLFKIGNLVPFLLK